MRGTKKNPGPGTYQLRKMLSKEEEEELTRKRREKVDYTKIPKRPMFMDQDMARTKYMPAPGIYTPKKPSKVKGNVAMLMERINYLDEAIRDK